MKPEQFTNCYTFWPDGKLTSGIAIEIDGNIAHLRGQNPLRVTLGDGIGMDETPDGPKILRAALELHSEQVENMPKGVVRSHPHLVNDYQRGHQAIVWAPFSLLVSTDGYPENRHWTGGMVDGHDPESGFMSFPYFLGGLSGATMRRVILVTPACEQPHVLEALPLRPRYENRSYPTLVAVPASKYLASLRHADMAAQSLLFDAAPPPWSLRDAQEAIVFPFGIPCGTPTAPSALT